ncbi:MAG: hypothetical protein WEB37_11795 [Bacteroidota bacterium]
MKVLVTAFAVLVVIGMLLAGCNRSEPLSPSSAATLPAPATLIKGAAGNTSGAQILIAGDDIFSIVNAALEANGEPYRLALYETITAPGSGEFGATVFAKNVGNKQLAYHFVFGDPRRSGRTNITYIVDVTEGSTTGGLSNAQTEPAIDNAMQTWNQESCSPLIQKVALGVIVDLGYVQNLLGFGGVNGWAADVTHGGWLPGAFFNAIAPGGSNFILGVTFTLLWIDGSGNFTDIDGDGKLDVAFRDIYYNNAFSWSISGPAWNDPQIDVESIVLHEAGHGLSQGHFGTVFFDGKGTKEPGFQLEHLHFSPRAVMNALYWETQRDLLGTDKAGHCSIWSSWQQ